jgi:hypothetical protein
MKKYIKKQTIKLVQDFININNINITLDEIQKMIFETMNYKSIFNYGWCYVKMLD